MLPHSQKFGQSDENPEETTVSCCCAQHFCSSGSKELSRLVTQALWLQGELSRTFPRQEGREHRDDTLQLPGLQWELTALQLLHVL